MPSIQTKVVGDFCNLRCTYCRDRDYDQGSKRVMSNEVLGHLIGALATLPLGIQRMHWLGGEPTLAGLDFFETAMGFQKMHEHKHWINTIQTNATLIDASWARFLKENHFRVGVSIDGTQQTHDADRINLAGRGSYDRVMNGVEVLRGSGINPSVICVVTKHNADKGPEMLRNLVESGFTSIAFNAFYNVATDFQRDPFAVSDGSWTAFLKSIFEEWLSIGRPEIKVRELDSMIAWTRGRTAKSCVFRGSCTSWMLVDHDGMIYPCERLGRSVCFGDIAKVNSFSEVLETDVYRRFSTQTLQVPSMCSKCPMQDFCHNGCVAHRINDGDTSPHYAYCGSRLAFHEYLVDRIGEIGTMSPDT